VGLHSTNNTTNVRDAVPKRGNGMTVALRYSPPSNPPRGESSG